MPMSPRLLRPRAAVSTGFDPRSIANLSMYLDAQDSATITQASGQVSAWIDKSGAGRTVNQTTASSRPTLFISGADVQTSTAATINGRQALFFDGANDFLSVTPRNLNRNIGGFTMFAVCEFNSISGTTPGLLYQQGTNIRQSLYLQSNEWTVASRRVGTDGLFSQSSSASGLSAGVPYLVRYTLNYQTAATTLHANGTQRISFTSGWATGNSADEDMSLVNIGLHSSAGYLNGKIGTMLFYQRVLSDAESIAVERHLGIKWGIYPFAPPNYADADVNAYINAVEAADQTHLETGVRNAINTFITGCKADGTWGAIKASCVMMGARTLAGALTPLAGAAPTNSGFLAADYNRKTGLVGNGSTKFLDTNYALGSGLQDNCHGSVWVSTAQTTGSHAYFGASLAALNSNSKTQIVAAAGAEGNLISRCFDETSNTSGTTNNAAGLQGVARTAPGSYTRRAAATNQTVSVSSSSGAESNMFVFRRASTASALHTTARLAFYSFGEALTLSQLESRVTSLYNGIGAAIVPQVANADAQDWLNRVYDNGGTVSASTADAVNTFCEAIKTAGIRDRFYRLNLFCGTGLNACLVPLYVNTSLAGATLGNATDTNNGPFASGDYVETGSSTGGLKGNGTTKHLNTGVNASSLGFSVADFHVSFYSKDTEAAGTSRYVIAAASTAGGNNFGLGWLNAGSVERYHYEGPSGNTLVSSTGGLEGHVGGQSGSGGGNLYHNGTSISSSANVPSGNFANLPVFVFWDGGSNVSRTLGRYMRGYSIGLSMSGPQWSSYYAAMQAFQTTLGRHV